MTFGERTYRDATIREIVGAEKDTILSTGSVKSADELALSALAQSDTVASSGGRGALDARASTAHGKAPASRARKAGTSATEAGKRRLPSPSGKPGDGASFASAAGTAFGNAAVDELDETEEFEGVSGMRDKAIGAKRIASRARSFGKRAGAAAHAETGSPADAASKKATRAVGASKRSAKAARSSMLRTGAPARAGASQAVGGAKAASAKTAASKTVGGAVASAIAPLGGVFAGILAFIFAALAIGQLVSALFGFWQNEASRQAVEGLPPYITYEIVEAALACQEEFGHPAGCTIAQIIVESGQGDHMSQLAERDHNLFGMKWSSSFASCPEVAGKSAWATNEEYEGQTVAVTAYFTSFVSDVDCIRFRSRVFLQAGTYANNPLIQEAVATCSSDLMAEGLKEAGWATSSSYVESLKSVMDAYGLRRFDGMTVSDLEGMEGAREAVLAAAYGQIGTPYVFGGTSPGVGLDCSGLTQYCYAQAGIPIPRNSEDQAAFGTKVPVSRARPGDILWKPGHVAIYAGGDKYIHEPREGRSCEEATGISYFSAAIQVIG